MILGRRQIKYSQPNLCCIPILLYKCHDFAALWEGQRMTHLDTTYAHTSQERRGQYFRRFSTKNLYIQIFSSFITR